MCDFLSACTVCVMYKAARDTEYLESQHEESHTDDFVCVLNASVEQSCQSQLTVTPDTHCTSTYRYLVLLLLLKWFLFVLV